MVDFSTDFKMCHKGLPTWICIKCMIFYVFSYHHNCSSSLFSMFFWVSPELKVQVSFSDHQSSVCLPVCSFFRPSVNFSHFHLLLQNHWAIFNQTCTKYPWVKGIQVCSNEGQRPSQRRDNYEITKINWQLLKIFFSRTTGPISTKLGTKYPWLKGFQVSSNGGPRPS